jgi:uncharacterized membrane protein YgdD (TMEM256/DUF423 family)
MNSRTTICVAAGLGIAAVGLGAYGAHALKPMLIASGKLEAYQTAVTYQFYHIFAMLATGILMNSNPDKKLGYASEFFLAGIILFSGSLYLLCFINLKYLGMVTPFGGLAFIAGWLLLLLGSLKKR